MGRLDGVVADREFDCREGVQRPDGQDSTPFSSPGAGGYPWQLAVKASGERLLGNSSTPACYRPCSECGKSFQESDGAPGQGLSAKFWRCRFCWAGRSEAPAFTTRELSIPLRGLVGDIQLHVLEAVDDYASQVACEARGEEEAFGARVWPTACACAERVLELGVAGRSILELGCGCGVVSLAALRGGARSVLATDRCIQSLQLVSASARLTALTMTDGAPADFQAELFDVAMEVLPLPGATRHLVCGNRRTGPYVVRELGTGSLAVVRPFDIVAFSDCLYWAKECHSFGRRAAQAAALGATVVVADPNEMWDTFLDAAEEEAKVLGVAPLCVTVKTFEYPPELFRWVSLMTGAGAYSAKQPPKMATISVKVNADGTYHPHSAISPILRHLPLDSWRGACDLEASALKTCHSDEATPIA